MKKYVTISITAIAILCIGIFAINPKEKFETAIKTPNPEKIIEMANEAYEGDFTVTNISQYPSPTETNNSDPLAVSTTQYVTPHISYYMQDISNPEFEFVITYNISEFYFESWYTSTYKVEKMYATIAEMCEEWVASGDVEITNNTDITVKNINLMNNIDEIVLDIHEKAALYEIECSSSILFIEEEARNLTVEYYFKEFDDTAELTLYYVYNLESDELKIISYEGIITEGSTGTQLILENITEIQYVLEYITEMQSMLVDESFVEALAADIYGGDYTIIDYVISDEQPSIQVNELYSMPAYTPASVTYTLQDMDDANFTFTITHVDTSSYDSNSLISYNTYSSTYNQSKMLYILELVCDSMVNELKTAEISGRQLIIKDKDTLIYIDAIIEHIYNIANLSTTGLDEATAKLYIYYEYDTDEGTEKNLIYTCDMEADVYELKLEN